jgi:hypothetical protein
MSPEIEKVYGQLLWVERRRQRVIAAVGSHFGHPSVERILAENKIAPLFGAGTGFSSLIDERGPGETLRSVAADTLRLEARTLATLRKHVSVYQHHVDEQILFGVRTAGQEAGRSFMAQSHRAGLKPERLEIPEAIQAVLELTFQGLPGERNHFLSLRAHGGSTLHFVRSPYLDAWRAENADPKFLHLNRLEWVRGMLDILSPETEYSTSHSLEEGGAFGLAQFHQRGVHAGP